MAESVFIDGQRYERAPGGGLVTPYVLLSLAAEVSPASVARDNSEIHDTAALRGESRLWSNAKVFGNSVIEDSTLREHAEVHGNVYISDSILSGTSIISGKAFVTFSQIKGNVRISGNASVTNSSLGANTRIGGNAQIHYVQTDHLNINEEVIIGGDAELEFEGLYPLSAGTRIMEGVWTRPPFVIKTPYFYTVESVGDRVLVGCTSHSVNYWIKYGFDVFTSLGYPAKEFPIMLEAMKKMGELKEKFKSPTKPQRTRRYSSDRCIL